MSQLQTTNHKLQVQCLSHSLPRHLQRLRQDSRFPDHANEVRVRYPARKDVHVNMSCDSSACCLAQIHSEIQSVRVIERAQNHLHALRQSHHLLGGIGREFMEFIQ